MNRFNTIVGKQCGALSRSITHHVYTEHCIEYHLGELERDFSCTDLDQAMVENVDETHLLINQDNRRTLGYVRDPNANYADVSSSDEGMTMVLRISGGVNSKVEAPFMIFENRDIREPSKKLSDSKVI